MAPRSPAAFRCAGLTRYRCLARHVPPELNAPEQRAPSTPVALPRPPGLASEPPLGLQVQSPPLPPLVLPELALAPQQVQLVQLAPLA